jgi:hypothetical protein
MKSVNELISDFKLSEFGLVDINDKGKFEIKKNGFLNCKKNNPKISGNVYLLIAQKTKKSYIVYIGMTTKVIKERIDGQLSGYNGQKGRGDKVAKIYKDILDKGYEIKIYYRNSQKKKILNSEMVSICGAEEAFLINKYKKEGEPIVNNLKSKDWYKLHFAKFV